MNPESETIIFKVWNDFTKEFETHTVPKAPDNMICEWSNDGKNWHSERVVAPYWRIWASRLFPKWFPVYWDTQFRMRDLDGVWRDYIPLKEEVVYSRSVWRGFEAIGEMIKYIPIKDSFWYRYIDWRRRQWAKERKAIEDLRNTRAH